MNIRHIAEDSEGFLWFATRDNGAIRFDGDEFQTLTKQDGLCSDWVFSIHKDRQERLWFGTLDGVCWYDGKSLHHLEDYGILGRPVQSFYEDPQGRIWFGGMGTLGYYEGAHFHNLIPLFLQRYRQPPSPQGYNECRGITQDCEGNLWFGFEYPVRFDGNSFQRFEEEEGFPQARFAYVVGRDHTGEVWIGLPRNRETLHRYADGAFQSVQADLGGGLSRIQCDREGRVWFCTKKGAHYQDGNGFSRFTTADGLPHPVVRAVFQDREHQFWFATWYGIGLYDAHSTSVFDFCAKRPQDVGEITQIAQDRRGDIWIGCATRRLSSKKKTVGCLKEEHVVFVDTEPGVDVGNCYAIYEDLDGNLWFGGFNGLFRYDGQTFEKVKTVAGLSDRSVNAISQDRKGRFLFGYWEGSPTTGNAHISRLKIVSQRGEQFRTIFEGDAEKDPAIRIGTVIAGSNSEVWFHLTCERFSGRGLARWHPIDGLKFYGIADGMTDQRVTDLLKDRRGNLWIATPNGLSYFDGGTFHTFTTEDGLPSNHIRCLFEDRRGHLWIGTYGGVVHYDGRLFQTIKSPHIGPVSRILEDRDGTFWFGTLLGTVVRYRPRHVSPRIRLLQVIGDRAYDDFEEAILCTTDQQIIFEYKGLSFSTHPRDMLYVYRLKGYDSDWQPATREMRAHYRDLPPGDYTFQVRAIDRDLNTSEAAQARISIAADPRIEAFTSLLNRRESLKFIGHSAALRQFQINLRRVASTDLTVLILGETGAGKGLAARALHALSHRCDGPFIDVSCGALPAGLIDSELFGHEKGAFTSAVSHRLGRVELAEGGTLFLDEIGDMAVETQVKLLRLLEEGTFERVGSSETLTARTRIVAATNRNLEELVGTGAFREDLYYRLNAFPLYLPPLRERNEDIPALAEYFKHRMAAHVGKEIDPLTPDVIKLLQSRDWPGNVRELEHAIQRAVVLCTGPRIRVEDVGVYGSPIRYPAPEPEAQALSAFQRGEILSLKESERRHILSVLEATNWRVKGARGAATLLGLPPSTLFARMKSLGIKDQMR